VFSRHRSEIVECRPGGDHVVSSARLHVVAARWSEFVRSMRLSRDAEAQHWLGWDPAEQLSKAQLLQHDPLLLTRDMLMFVGLEKCSGHLVASITLYRGTDGCYDIGGVVNPDVRGQHFGRETLDAVCHMAHRHFGIVRLRAGCETNNVASQRWLTSCGFERTGGPQHHVLPNGWTIASLWWHRVDATARRRCRRVALR
jgi:RimJ/RimL family protein N-acetyltransferase